MVAAADSFPCPTPIPKLRGVMEKLAELILEEQRPATSSVPPTSHAAYPSGSEGQEMKASSSKTSSSSSK